ncbi:hypothetical protein [Aurantiacibacter gangjinensis]|uniref:Uncharacterized protein n=1 Tax=Aurantiacibacter gangjinensis TaxID=502682 RepID=A0A0G9MKZ6_9SPHN|nr:hypothetical protein [Aurantiacibacter gangjinensis]APE27234.1 hypothetical protein BMF35_a0405 [Aurantiacibacter gangjinensis]KLE31357.1 hypothetical protein AAW01_07035 [Aurantiacibacter gangjinensis]
MFKALASAAAAASLALGAGVALADEDERAERAENAFAELVEGRTAGEPRTCIVTIGRNDRIRIEENVGVVYERGDTMWVARARNPENLSYWDVPIIERYGSSQLCRQDIMRTIDRSTGIFSGVIFLDDFVPYTRNDDADA